jgi:hypothetical protein
MLCLLPDCVSVTLTHWAEGSLNILCPDSQFTTLFFLIMSLAIALSLLAQGNTGSDLLQILDSIVEEVSEV